MPGAAAIWVRSQESSEESPVVPTHLEEPSAPTELSMSLAIQGRDHWLVEGTAPSAGDHA